MHSNNLHSNNLIDISIIIPVYNEEKNLISLCDEIKDVMNSTSYNYEIIIVNDGSTDETESVIASLHTKDTIHNKGINFSRNYGKAAALRAGFGIAQGSTIITMDGDGQDDPAEIPRFISKINEGYDLVSGWKYTRLDSMIKNNTSKIYNFVTSVTSGIYLHDHNCGFKAYRSEVAKSLPLYANLHRFIPILAKANGYTKIAEMKVHHRERLHGKSKYGPSRFIYGITGLINALWISRDIKNTLNNGIKLKDFSFKSILL